MTPFLSSAFKWGLRSPLRFPQHRRGMMIPGYFVSANRAASSNQPYFIRRWRRFGCFHQSADW